MTNRNDYTNASRAVELSVLIRRNINKKKDHKIDNKISRWKKDAREGKVKRTFF